MLVLLLPPPPLLPLLLTPFWFWPNRSYVVDDGAADADADAAFGRDVLWTATEYVCESSFVRGAKTLYADSLLPRLPRLVPLRSRLLLVLVRVRVLLGEPGGGA